MAISRTYELSRVEKIRRAFQAGKLRAKDAKELLANPTLPVESRLSVFSSGYVGSTSSRGQGTSRRPASAPGSPELPFAFSFTRYKNFVAPIDFGTPDSDSNPSHVLPVTPEEVSISLSNSASTVTTIAGRTFTHAAGLDLEKISFSAYFPHNYGYEANSLITPGFDPVKMGSPGELANKFRLAMHANQPFIFAVNKIGDDFGLDNIVVSPMEMTISSFQRTVKAGHGSDIFYEMELQRWYPQEGHVAPPPRTYTTKGNESLARIALHQLGSAMRWKEIKKLNPDNYYFLYPPRGPNSKPTTVYTPVRPGVVLILPRK